MLSLQDLPRKLLATVLVCFGAANGWRISRRKASEAIGSTRGLGGYSLRSGMFFL